MDILFPQTGNKQDCLIIPFFQEEPPLSGAPSLAGRAAWLNSSPALADLSGKRNEMLMLYAPAGENPARALLVGMGKYEKFAPEVLRDAVACAVQEGMRLKLSAPALPLEALEHIAAKAPFSLEQLLEDAALGALLSTYSCELYRGKKTPQEPRFQPASLEIVSERSLSDAEQNALRKAQAVAKGMFYARDLINGPANIVTPAYMEQKAKALSRQHGFSCASYGPDYLRDFGFGAFWAVAKGAAEEPRLIILEHTPSGMEKDAPLIFIGKGVTFDSGGISLKPSAGMQEMKTDIAGAATVLGLFAAMGESADLLPKRRVIGIMPCAENMPGGEAVRPGDIALTLSGKTVEIVNTDAEGRLLLCDCLTLAQQHWQAEAIIDIATLTGACKIALGDKAAGLFSNNEALSEKLRALSVKCSERVWPMPIWEDDIDGLKSDTADLLNTGPREGGAVFAALFLKQFVEEGTPWAHFDVAGPARVGKKTPICPVGGSAVCLRTFYELLLS